MVDRLKLIMGVQNRNLIIERDTLINGKVIGNIKVLPGAKLNLKAKLEGDLYLSKFSHVSIQNKVVGKIFDEGAGIEFIEDFQGEIIRVY